MIEVRQTNCHFCGYCCAFLATVEDGRIVDLSPDPTRYPYDERILAGCRRWKMNLDVLDSPRRVNHPIKRVGERGSGLDMSKIMEGSEQGLFTLANWMDDCMDAMLGQKIIPGTDMFLEESTMTYGLRVDQEYVTDHRPIYYGFINCSFAGYATENANREIEKLL